MAHPPISPVASALNAIRRPKSVSITANRCLIAAVLVLAISASAYSAPPIHLEILVETGAPLTGAQKWIRLLNECGFRDVRIRSGRAGDKMSIKKTGSKTLASYRVIGYLNSRGGIELPGGRFTIRDKAKIKAWVKKVQADGSDELFAKRGLFGLTAEELVAIHEKLAVKVAKSSKNMRCGDVARAIVAGLKIPYTVSPAAVSAFASQETVIEELQGLSSGTALAAAIRPLGLVIAPRKLSGKPVELLICKSGEVKKSWPIGWPLDAKKTPIKTAPSLFKYVRVEIQPTKISKALSAIEGKINIPLLYDRNTILLHRIDLKNTLVKLPLRRVYYKKLIDELARQAKLRSELRVDEIGKPFLWITSRRAF